MRVDWLFLGLTAVIAVAKVGWLFWARAERNCMWCRYEKGCRAKGDQVWIQSEHHTCWRGAK